MVRVVLPLDQNRRRRTTKHYTQKHGSRHGQQQPSHGTTNWVMLACLSRPQTRAHKYHDGAPDLLRQAVVSVALRLLAGPGPAAQCSPPTHASNINNCEQQYVCESTCIYVHHRMLPFRLLQAHGPNNTCTS